MKKIFLLLFVPILLIGQNKFTLDIDYATFPLDTKSGIVELYYAYPQNCLTVTGIAPEQSVGGILNVKVKKADSKQIVVDKYWKFTSNCDTIENGKSLIGVLRFKFDAGKYNFSVTGTDLNDSTAFKIINFDVAIIPLDKNNITISNIEAASSIVQESKNINSMFYKNTMEITPNVVGIYGLNFPVIFFYSEIYNVNKGIGAKHLKVDHLLVNSRNKNVFAKSKFISRKNSSIVDVGAIKVNKFPTGAYNLVVSVTDTVTKFNIASIKKLYIYNPGILDTAVNQLKVTDVLTSELVEFSLEELNKMFEQSKYIASNDEIKEWKKISNVVGKRKFLQKFWSNRDEDRSTPQNETMKKYFERVRYADRHYKNFSKKEGWMTDMGRVYVVYGEPYEIERYPSDQALKPYEIWFYDKIEGGVTFAFGDQTGYGDYRLLNSTKRGELQNPNWQQSLLVR